MTALCGGGTSAPKPTTLLAVDFTVASISVALAEYGATWALAAIPFVTSLPGFVLSTFCGSDPPAIPTFTAAEANAILQLTFSADFYSGLPKLADLITHVMWYQFCQCTSGTAVALPPAPAPPSGTNVPVNIPAPNNPNCAGLKNSDGTAGPWNSGSNVFAAGDTSSPLAYLWSPTDQPTSYRLTLKNTTASGAGATIKFRYAQFQVFTAGTFPVGSPAVTVAPGATQTVIVTATPGNPFLELYVDTVTGTGTADTIGSMLEAYCGGAVPGGVQTPCCPPDDATRNTLDAILTLVTLTQRQLAPFATIHGAVHSGLSGTGTIAVHGLIGLKVAMTTVPGRLGMVFGEPVDIYDAGWVNWGTADGYGPRVFITSNPLLIQPIAPNVTVIGYSIPADVTVSITELIREP
jgi:hypothetical protein